MMFQHFRLLFLPATKLPRRRRIESRHGPDGKAFHHPTINDLASGPMLRVIFLAWFSIAVVPVAAQGIPSTSPMFDLSSFQWSHRPLLIFAPSSEAPSYQEQRQRLASESVRAGLVDRDMVVVHLIGVPSGRLVRPTVRGAASEQPLSAEDVEALRERFEVPADVFVVVLVGKDGTEKRRDPSPVSAKALFETIDAMPMRQREMRGDG
jgi:hypothetical protein